MASFYGKLRNSSVFIESCKWRRANRRIGALSLRSKVADVGVFCGELFADGASNLKNVHRNIESRI